MSASPTTESSPDRGGSGSLSVEVKFSRALRDSLKLELEKEGWTFARGRRNKSDWCYCKPGIQYKKKGAGNKKKGAGNKKKGAGNKKNVHYFRSLRQLVAFLKSDEGSEFVPPERLEELERGARAVAEAVSADDGADLPPQEEEGAVSPGPRRGDGDGNALGAAAAGMSYRRMLIRDWLRSLDAKDGRDNCMEAYAPAFGREFSDTDQVARASSMCGAQAILNKCEVECLGDRVDLSLAISHLASSFAERPTVNLTNNAEPEEDRMRARRGRKRIEREDIIELSSDEGETEAEAEVVGDLERERARHGRKRAKAIEILSSDDDD